MRPPPLSAKEEESAPEQILTLKVTLLLALTSLKWVGELQALSISEMCMDSGEDERLHMLWPVYAYHMLITLYNN